MFTSKKASAGQFKAAQSSRNAVNMPLMAGLGAMFILATYIFDVSELIIAAIGAALYHLYKTLARPVVARTPIALKKAAPVDVEDNDSKVKPRFDVQRGRPAAAVLRTGRCTEAQQASIRTRTKVPIATPTFQSTGFDAEVAELIPQLLPNTETQAAVESLVAVVTRALVPRIPGVEISGFANGNPLLSKAFGVALPEIDIVIDASPIVLARCLDARLSRGAAAAVRKDEQKLQKAALRACTDEIVSITELKFRRSGFRGDYPKVTLLAPAALVGADRSIGFDMSVNSAAPLHNAMLLTECGQLEPRAKELIMLVRRWTRDRGIAHAPKGHLSHHGWTLLSIYFLQVRHGGAGALLPAIEGFGKSATLIGERQATHPWDRAHREVTVATLFKEFVHFYNAEFDWRNEAISVRCGQRAAPSFVLPIHIVEGTGERSSIVAPQIEDPFDAKRNIATCMTHDGVIRMREEFARAQTLLLRDGQLNELLELWAPPEVSCTAETNHD